MRTVVFDLDGTLADTSGDLIAAANACFEGMGLTVRLDPAADAGIAVKGGRAMLTAGLERAGAFSEELIARWYPELLSVYGEAIDRYTRFYPGALDAVQGLRAAGYKVSICTNKPERLAELLMQRMGARGHFDALIGADTLRVRKPDAAPYVAAVERAGGQVAQSVLVGDTATDRNTARAAGVPCILVGFGPDGETVSALEPEAMIGHFDELAGAVAALIG